MKSKEEDKYEATNNNKRNLYDLTLLSSIKFIFILVKLKVRDQLYWLVVEGRKIIS